MDNQKINVILKDDTTKIDDLREVDLSSFKPEEQIKSKLDEQTLDLSAMIEDKQNPQESNSDIIDLDLSSFSTED